MFLALCWNLPAQNNTNVLLEMTTATGCYHCPGGNRRIDSLTWMHPDKVILVRYQCPLNSYDPIYYQDSAEINRRIKFIFPDNVFGLPGTYHNGQYQLNGNPELYNSELIDSIYNLRSHFQLTLNHSLTADCDSILITFTITSDTIQEFPAGSLKGRLIVMEDSVYFQYPPGNNGEKDFYFECRKFIPDQNGFDIPVSWTTGMTRTFTFPVTIPSYIYDLNNLYMVGFIQRSDDRTILQSVKDNQVKLPWYAGISSNLSLDFQPFTCDTVLKGASVFVKNMGTLVLTSFKLLYKIDSQTFDTLAWSGTLLPDELTEITLPDLDLTGDGHHLVSVKVTDPNHHWIAESFASKYSATIEVNVIPDEPPLHEYFTQKNFPYKGWFIHNPNKDGNTWIQVTYPTFGETYKLGALLLRDFTMMPGTANEFYLPEMAVHQTTSMSLTFDVSHVKTGGPPDTLTVLMSNDCGNSWDEVYRKTGEDLFWTSIPWPEWIGEVPDSTDDVSWKRQTINLSDFQPNSTILVKFRYVRAEGNNTYIRNIYLGPHTSIGESMSATLMLYPNPTRGWITIDPGKGSDIGKAEVVNILGNIVYTVQSPVIARDPVHANLSHLPDGAYIVRISTSQGSVYRKFIINH